MDPVAVCTASQGSLNLFDAHLHTPTRKEGIARTVDTVDGRSVGIGIGLPTTFGGSGNARATETAFPPTEMR